MRWETTVWMSVVLVVTTTALHLTIEHHLQIDQTSPPGLDTSTNQDIVHVISGFGELVASPETKKKHDSDEPNIKSRSKASKTTEEEDSQSDSDEDGEETTESAEEIDPGGGENEATTSTPVPGETDPGNEGEPNTPSPPVTEDSEPGDEGAQSTTSPPGTGDNESGGEGGTQSPTSLPEPDDTIVKTTSGPVRGHVWRENANIISYIDIKYGTFDNLFEAPVFPKANEDVHDEKVHNKRCPQLQGDKSVGVSDCLTLSIFKSSKDKLIGASVLVHIHEGNFINESANPEIYGPEYLVPEEIILVLPNYRLGPLGFLCLRNETAPGNAALKDLSLALRWVKENIENFGGDPENIAVSGEGTAGALAGYLALSPMSKSYISKVITESGSILSHWAIDRNPTAAATDLADSITGSWASWQSIDMEVLQLAARDIVWRPCVEDNTDDGVHFMVETPWEMLKKEDIKITFMIGSAEYAGVHESFNHPEVSIEQINANFSLILPNDLQFETSEDMSRVGNKVIAHYFSEDDDTLNNVKYRTLYYTDVAYLGPGIRTARSLVNSGSTVYFYEFSFVGDLNRELAAVEKQVDGAVRGDIIGYLFNQEDVMPVEGTKERDMIEQLIQFWTSFLKTGTPKAKDILWNKFEKATAEQEQWLSIGTKTAMTRGVHVGRLDFWTDIYNDHFIDRSLALGLSPSVYTVLLLQAVFFISFFRNAWHFF